MTDTQPETPKKNGNAFAVVKGVAAGAFMAFTAGLVFPTNGSYSNKDMAAIGIFTALGAAAGGIWAARANNKPDISTEDAIKLNSRWTTKVGFTDRVGTAGKITR